MRWDISFSIPSAKKSRPMPDNHSWVTAFPSSFELYRRFENPPFTGTKTWKSQGERREIPNFTPKIFQKSARLFCYMRAPISEFVAVEGLPSRSASSICVRPFSNMLHHFAIAWRDIAFSPHTSCNCG
ncbi:hypothetical protein NPIL_23321 [Nephila pilipes]|uniref:Uncharacterized protein n=1 Tax=Nephila pilipes TaxID=299642 RepID=A0A8X6NU07_NEPPI|nr:hypothetical protein NPIL_23321 [Nephila pilipes]